ncbi:MAG: cupin domain-containing protein [Rubrobacteraceae bacterium]
MDEASRGVQTHEFEDDGRIPNNPELPLLVYPGALSGFDDPDATFRGMLKENGWGGAWRDGVFPYHHYHSTSHEVLAVVGGGASLTFGGGSGVTLEVEAGDVVVIPAGVGHKNDGSRDGFSVIGAYPRGQESWDLRTGEPDERPEILENIRNVPLPEKDPVFGEEGPLLEHWRPS